MFGVTLNSALNSRTDYCNKILLSMFKHYWCCARGPEVFVKALNGTSFLCTYEELERKIDSFSVLLQFQSVPFIGDEDRLDTHFQ